MRAAYSQEQRFRPTVLLIALLLGAANLPCGLGCAPAQSPESDTAPGASQAVGTKATAEPAMPVEVDAVLAQKPSPEAQGVSRHISQAWEKLDSGVDSAEIRYRSFNGNGWRLRPRYFADVRRIVEKAGLAEHPENALDLIPEVVLDSALERLGDHRHAWRTGVFRKLGPKQFRAMSPGAMYVGAMYLDADVLLYYGGLNNSLSLFRSSVLDEGSALLRQFVVVAPTDSLFEAPPEEIGEKSLLFHSDRDELLLDRETGFIHRSTTVNEQGRVVREVFQFAPMQFGDGVILPRLKLEFRYDDDSLTGAEFTLIDEAHINEPIDPSGLFLALPAGATILDGRDDPLRPTYYRVDEGTPDALSLVTGDLDNGELEVIPNSR